MISALRSLSKVEQPYNNVSKVMTEIKLHALKRFGVVFPSFYIRNSNVATPVLLGSTAVTVSPLSVGFRFRFLQVPSSIADVIISSMSSIQFILHFG